MGVLEYMRDRVLLLDGGMGTLLQKRGLTPGELPETWCLTHPDVIRDIHDSYFRAGSRVVSANTFGANLLKFTETELESIVAAAIGTARASAEAVGGDRFVALDIGPSGRLLCPFGDLDFEDAYDLFAATVRLGVKYGADLILIETMNDSYETKAALLAAKESSSLPVFVSNAYGADGKLMTGAEPEAMAALIEGMGADAVGVNCSLGPVQLAPVVERLLSVSSIPVLLKPNAGLPSSCCGHTVYDISPSDFASEVARQVRGGVRIAGGCCGTTPEYIGALCSELDGVSPVPVSKKSLTVISSYTHAVTFGASPVLIGERINPTGKRRLKTALIERDMDYILGEAISEAEHGAHVLDVNVGLPDICESELLPQAVTEIQAVCDLPLQIDSSDPVAMEAALRVYNGKAMINSVNGKEESMAAIFPLVRKYGGVVVALTLDENGIPRDAEGRIRIAEKILGRAAEYGISGRDIVFDTLAMTVSADQSAPKATIDALRAIRHELGCHTSLGVSNVSFGLPCRDTVNGAFFISALEAGLSAAIMNPYSEEMMRAYYSFRALHGLDPMCADYIEFMSGRQTIGMLGTAGTGTAGTGTADSGTATAAGKSQNAASVRSALSGAIVRGMKDQAASVTRELLATVAPMELVDREIIPALDEVGRSFEEHRTYLPQLLMSAEAAKSAASEIKDFVSRSSGDIKKRCTFVIATVKGDIHDIGKNIVKLLLENYGFAVVDLGRDVPPESVVEAVVRTHAPIVGLSALMTTTVPAMEETIRELRRSAPWCRVVVGGAVLTREYAESIGADRYAADAMETVRYAEEVDGEAGNDAS